MHRQGFGSLAVLVLLAPLTACESCSRHRCHDGDDEGDDLVDSTPNGGQCVVADVVVGDEQTVGSETVSVPGANALDPAIAFDGTNYLAVWTDWRSGNGDIWAARVSPDGTVLDRPAFPVATSPDAEQHAAIVFDGTEYVVAWEDAGSPTTTSVTNIVAARISTAGVITSLGPIAASSTTSQVTPVLAAAPTGVVVAWVSDAQIVAGFLGSNPAPRAITSGTVPHAEPALAVAGTGEILVAYSEKSPTNQDDIRGQLLAPDGTPSGSPLAISTGVSRTIAPALAFDGTNFIVTYVGYSTGVDIYATRLTTSGVVLDHHVEGGVQVGGTLLAGAVGYQEVPSLTCRTTNECLVVWQDSRTSGDNDIYGVRFQPSNLAILGSQFALSTSPRKQTVPKVAADAHGYFTAWLDARAGGDASQRVIGTRISSVGEVLDASGLVLDTGTNFQQYPTLANTEDGLLLGWNDSVSTSGDDILFAQLDQQGMQRPNRPVAAATAAPFTQQDASIASREDLTVVAWRDYRDAGGAQIRVARIRDPGVVVDPDGLLLAPTGTWDHPRVATNGSTALVTWVYSPSQAVRAVYGALVLASGTVGQPFVIADGTNENDRPAVAWDPATDQYVVVWHAGPRNRANTIRAARVSSDGDLLDPGGVLIGSSAGNVANARIAFVGRTGLVVYQDTSDTNHHVVAVRVVAGTSLAPMDSTPIALTTQAGTQASPDVTVMGDTFFVAWTDTTNINPDIWGQRVAADGSGLGPPIPIARGEEVEDSPTVAGVDSTQVVVAYRVHRTAPAARVVTRHLDLPDCVVVK